MSTFRSRCRRGRMVSLFGALSALLLAPGLGQAATLYVPMGASNGIQVVDTTRGEVIARIPGVVNPHGLAITPDGKYLIAPSAKPAGHPDTERGAGHHASATQSATRSGPQAAPSQVDIIRTADRKTLRRIAFPGASHHIAASPDGRYAVVTHRDNGNISLVDMASASDPDATLKMRTVAVGGMPAYALVSPDSRRIFVSDMRRNVVTVVDAETATVRRHIAVPGGPWHMALSPDGHELYLADVAGGTLSVVSLREGKVVRTLHIGGTLHGVAVSANGKRVFLADMAQNRLVAVDLATGREHEIAIPVPFHVTAIRSNGDIAVTSRARPALWLVSESTLKIAGRIPISGTGHQIAVAR